MLATAQDLEGSSDLPWEVDFLGQELTNCQPILADKQHTTFLPHHLNTMNSKSECATSEAQASFQQHSPLLLLPSSMAQQLLR